MWWRYCSLLPAGEHQANYSEACGMITTNCYPGSPQIWDKTQYVSTNSFQHLIFSPPQNSQTRLVLTSRTGSKKKIVIWVWIGSLFSVFNSSRKVKSFIFGLLSTFYLEINSNVHESCKNRNSTNNIFISFAQIYLIHRFTLFETSWWGRNKVFL